MPAFPQQPDLQLRSLRLYGELLCRRESWAHQLVFACFAGAASSGLAAAASLAGAASLIVDANAAEMKSHYRDGAYDFVVNTLDEALRAIKNEVRQGHPIAIGLIGEPAAVLYEATKRGLAAAFVLRHESQDLRALRAVMETNAAVVIDGAEPSTELTNWLAQLGWSPRVMESPAQMFDDAIRQKWMRDLPALQRSLRGGTRWAWL